MGLVEAQEARDADCADIRRDLHASYDRGVKASGRARRHMRECDGCREYRAALRGVRRSFAALSPAAASGRSRSSPRSPALGGAGGGAAAAAGAGGAAERSPAWAREPACKVAAVVCATAIGDGRRRRGRSASAPTSRTPARRGTRARAARSDRGAPQPRPPSAAARRCAGPAERARPPRHARPRGARRRAASPP